jgi:CheY-like chemotaxis protein
MTESILNHKRFLVVDDEPDILDVIVEEILQFCPDSRVDKALDYEEAAAALKSKDYDLVVLDIMGVRGFELLEIAVTRKFGVAMLTAHSLNPEALKKSHDMGARAYLPKDRLGDLVPFLEEIWLNDYKTGWKRILNKLEKYYDEVFEPDWRIKAGIKTWY